VKFIDFFAGIGTMRMGFQQAGWECVYSIEWDKWKRKMYEVIFGGLPDESDIRSVNGRGLPDADCWCFGAPCQDFSIAGTRTGLEGDRSSLVREVFRLIREIKEEYRPKWLLYENVKGMLSSNKGFDYLEILNEMASLGYDIEYQLLNSKDFGVPQNRERVFTIGHLRGKPWRKVFPIGGTDTETNNDVKCLNSKNKAGKQPQQHDRIYSTNGLMTALMSSEQSGRYNIKVKGMLDIPGQENIRRVYDTDGLSPCLTTMEGGNRQPKIMLPCIAASRGRNPINPSDRTSGNYVEQRLEINTTGNSNTITTVQKDNYVLDTQSRIRRLTPRECMRLQGVSDEVTDKLIAAGISDTQMYRGAGDACTTNVIYEIARRLL